MTDSVVQIPIQAAPPSSDADEPTWTYLVDDIESAADRLAGAVQDLTELLDRLESEEDAPEDIRAAADDLGLTVYSADADITRQIGRLREAPSLHVDD